METNSKSLISQLSIQPLQQDDQGRLTGGFSAALANSSNLAQNTDDSSGSNFCVNIKCNVVAGCGAKQ
ncbi:hypothetical protein SAMN05660895_2291 [Thermoflavifilum thermophilum]|uniref:Uncharacterized protein n=1 Tax=Thermoflavifilum thermophilum TaxID=1393122 RepID=A0A1I7NM00_9BACT|nr:hypothetical protein SAMN05660895_2291 [Thermoflavifilum thermophilum]